MPKAFFMVRAVVADLADRPAFDTWYEKEHLPDALAAFGVAHAWRCWAGRTLRSISPSTNSQAWRRLRRCRVRLRSPR